MRLPLLILAALPSAGPADADTLNVPADFPTIQAALDAAQDGDEIVLAPATYESPDIVIDRSLIVTIRSTNPDDPAVVAATVLTDPTDAGALTVRGDSFGIDIDLLVRGVTFTRPAEQSPDPLIEVRGADARFELCRFDGGDATTRSGGIVRCEGEAGSQQPMIVFESCEFFGDVGFLIFDEASLLIDDADIREGDASFSWFGGDDGTLVVEDTTFSNLRPALFQQFDVRSNFDEPALFERVTIADVPGRFLEARDILLRDVTIERSGTDLAVLSSGRGFIDADVLTIEGLTVRDCVIDRFSDDLIWFINANREMNARNLTFERNAGADIWLHGINDDSFADYTVENAVFRDNNAVYAVVEMHNSGTIRDCLFERNIVAPDPKGFGQPVGVVAPFGRGTSGGLFGSQRIRIDRCTFRNNSGGFGPFGTPGRVRQNNVVVSESIFEGNTGTLGGAAATPIPSVAASVYSEGQGWITFRHCLIVGNSSDQGGVHFGGARYESCVIVGNSGDVGSLGFGSAAVIDSILIGDGSATPTVADTVFDQSIVVARHSIVPPDAQGTSTTTLDPLFVRVPSDGGDGWGDDPDTPGTDESLNDDFGDLRLRPGSPAIDAGSRGIIRFFERDLDGNSRLRDDPGIPDAGRNGTIDIGPYEFQGVTCLPDVNGDGVLSPADFNGWILAFNAGGSLADQNRDGLVTAADFNAWILNFNAGCD